MVFPCIPTCSYMKQYETVRYKGGCLFKGGGQGGTCLTFSKTTKVAQALVQLVVFEKLQVLICMRKHVNTC